MEDLKSKAVERPVLWSQENADPGETVQSFWFRATPLMFIVLVVLLACLSLFIVHSATIAEFGNRLFWMQVLWVGLGVGACVVATLLPLSWMYRHALWGVLLILPTLLYLALAKTADHLHKGLLTKFPFVMEVKGAVRWLRIGPISVQPSEFAKLFLVLFLAAYYGRLRRERIRDFVPGVLVPGLVAGTILGLILYGKDLSTTFVTGGMVFSIMYMAGIRFRYVALILALGALVVFGSINFSPMRQRRIAAFQHPELYKEKESYQLYRSLLCLGVGGVTGRGVSKGYMKSYLPEAHTDFIVAVFGEEFGAAGVLTLLAVYLLLSACIVQIVRQCRDRSDMLMCLGIAVLITLQALVNIGVVSGCIPPTGVTAPFLSYGGSSILSLMFLAGLVLNVAWRNIKAVNRELLDLRCIPRA